MNFGYLRKGSNFVEYTSLGALAMASVTSRLETESKAHDGTHGSLWLCRHGSELLFFFSPLLCSQHE